MQTIITNTYIRQVKRLYLWLVIGFVFFIAWSHSSEFSAAIAYLDMLSAELVILCLGLALVSYICRSLRWLVYIRLIEHNTSIIRHIVIYLSGFAFTASPGKAGELMRGTYLGELGVSFRYTFMSFLSERLFDVIVVSLLGTYFLILQFDVYFCFLTACFLIIPFIVGPIFKIGLRIGSVRLWCEPIKILVNLWRRDVVINNQVLTLLAWSAQGLILFLILRIFEVEINIVMAISIYCLSLLIGAASFIPSGIGVTEAGMIWLLNQIGVSTDIAIVASLITRMLTLWPAMISGVVCSFILRRSSSKNINSYS
ncbi:lysylphosphatidylglycerol synthase transmembrane domain-containing protein [Vibrio fluvialis]|uniref:lysylphosphatidylglycerol synthase transmembrane domain-containing protein n=1 Tax=Vibrio fluvialis TaxID=676 RepID=UPI00096BB41E|nr:lysylphosphatidylglycerol synthase transmembrane domain-containing protein [Vibrio fluvialis]